MPLKDGAPFAKRTDDGTRRARAPTTPAPAPAARRTSLAAVSVYLLSEPVCREQEGMDTLETT